MKTLVRIAAILSFGFFLAGGLLLVGLAVPSPGSDALPIMAVALFFVGTAFFAGPMLLAAAERFGRTDEAK